MRSQVKVLAISGSIRPNSSNHRLLNEIENMVKDYSHVTMEQFAGLSDIPAFDGREDDPESVRDFKMKVRAADGILICTPEYAFGVPGALKNALDWTVGSADFMDKPVALITASSNGQRAHESLQLTLQAIAAELNTDTNLLMSFIRAKVKDGKIVDDESRLLVNNLISNFIKRLSQK